MATTKTPKAKPVKAAPIEAVPVKKVEAKIKNDLQIALFDIEGKEVKKTALSSDIFGVTAAPALIAQYIRVYLANKRQGNASTKTRSEVIGTTKKVYKQKGTGRARHGSRKAALFKGGGVTFGPQTRDFSLKMNKKQKRRVLFAVLSEKVKENAFFGLIDDAFSIEPKTKTVALFLKNMQATDKKTLFVFKSFVKNPVYMAARNIHKVKAMQVDKLNPYEIIHHDQVVVAENALPIFESHFLKNA